MIFLLDLLGKGKNLGRAQVYAEEALLNIWCHWEGFRLHKLMSNLCGAGKIFAVTWQLPHFMSILAVVQSQSGRIYPILEYKVCSGLKTVQILLY